MKSRCMYIGTACKERKKKRIYRICAVATTTLKLFVSLFRSLVKLEITGCEAVNYCRCEA